jgi:hypothetical protein
MMAPAAMHRGEISSCSGGARRKRSVMRRANGGREHDQRIAAQATAKRTNALQRRPQTRHRPQPSSRTIR